MQLYLHSIELSNIRAHKHIKFSPKSSGITALSGGTGAGKSTIVDSLAWALYGTKPQGVKKASEIYRNTATFPEDKGFVEVILKVDAEYIKVLRKIVNKAGAVECEVYKSEDGDLDNWTLVAGPAVSHAESFIRKYLLMDEKGFLSSIFIQQKKVDELITASPRERAKVIEKLIRVTPITNALDKARAESNSLKKAIELSTADESTLADLEKELSETRESLSKGANFKKVYTERVATTSEKVDNYRSTLKDLEKTFRERRSINQSLESNRNLLELTVSSITEATERRKALKRKIETFEAAGNRDLIENNLKEISKEEGSLNKKVYAYETLQGRTESSEQDLKKFIEENSLAKTERGLTSALKRESEELNKTELSLSEKNSSLIVEKAKLLSLEESKRDLLEFLEGKEKGPEGTVQEETVVTCPTCEQGINKPEELLSHKDEEIKETQELIEALTKEQKTLEQKVRSLKSSVRLIENALEKNSEIKASKEKLSNLEKEYSSIKKEKLPALEVKRKALEKVWHRISQLEETKTEIESLTEKIKTSMLKRADIEGTISELSSKKSSLKDVTEEQIERASGLLERESAKLKQQEDKLNEGSYKIAILEEREKHLSERVEREKKALEAYKDLLKAQTEAVVSINAISEFREETIEKSVPAIESMASDFFTSFTEGKFTGLRIGSKFNLEAQLANGKTQSVGLLSGGELSAAALSLFFAVSILRNSGSASNAIILDEPFTAQDSSRTEIILNTIKKYMSGQVIIIAHNAAIEGVVDETFNVEEEVKKALEASNEGSED